MAQTLEALCLRRQLEHGELIQQEYLEGLNALDSSQAPAEARPKLAGAIEALQSESEAVPSPPPESDTPIPEIPAIVNTPIPERFLTMNCPRCTAGLSIYDQTRELKCGACGAEVIVERKDCTIVLRLPAEAVDQPDPVALAEASAKRDEELEKLRAEAAMITNVKRVAGILGGFCGLGLAYMGLTELAARHIAIGAGVLIGGGALMASVVCITRHTTKVLVNLAARIRAITTSAEYLADHS